MRITPKLLPVVAFAALAAAFALLCYKLHLDSDRIFFDDLFTSLSHGARWRDWKMPPAPGYVPDLLFYWMATWFVHGAAARLFVVSVAQGLVCALAAIWLGRTLLRRCSSTFYAAILLALALAVVNSARAGMWLFLNSNNVHVSVSLFGLVTAALLISRVSSKPVVIGVLLAIVGAVATLSSALYTIAVAVPVLFALGCSLAFKAVRPSAMSRRGITIFMLGIVVGQILAALLHRVITFHDALSGRVPLSFAGARNSLHWLFTDLGALLTRGSQFGKVFAFMIVLSMTYSFVQILVYGKEETSNVTIGANMRWSLLFATSSVFFTAAGAVASGGFVDAYSMRYFAFPFSMFVVLALVSLDQAWRPLVLQRVYWISAAVVLTLALSSAGVMRAQARYASLSDSLRYGSGVPVEQVAIDCIKELDASGAGLRDGIGGYWFARSIQYVLPTHHMLQIDDTLHPFFWMMNAGTFNNPSLFPRFYNFAIVKASEDSTAATISTSRLPVEGRSIHQCRSGGLAIWYYRDDTLQKLMTANNAWYVASPFYH
ncbi:hypothetical protein [Robbsia sp. KACC 23696]|uniref:hypothetical protein n=1 Tax=Robbsia sp. KACC 23696 TaxID=3149231 RepID=UPI00325ABDC0